MATTYAIPDGRTVMAATLYTGTGATASISNAVNGVSFQPDFVWQKSRSAAYENNLYDVNRGTATLVSNITNAENVNGASDFVSYNSNGFTINQSANYELSHSGTTYVAWQWKAGGTAVSNTSGSITSSVSANTTAGFSVVTYTGTGANATVGHGLGVAPSMIIVKSRSAAATNWVTYTASQGATKYLLLNTTGAVVTDSTPWNNTSPTSSVFSVGTSTNTNGNTSTFVAYCWAPVAGYSAFGSYTGNGSADGPFVYCGFRPRFVLVKAASGTNASSANWLILDSSRSVYNATDNKLAANLTDAENSAGIGNAGVNSYDFLSNGIKARTTSGSSNENNTTYIFMAFAENPFKYANAR